MQLGTRIGQRAKLLGLSQSELARAAAVPQSTINTLINGDSRWSPHLLRLARALRTTPAYLTGETDDPDADGPPAPELTHDQKHLIDNFEKLERADRAALLRIAESMATHAPASPTVHSPRVTYQAEEAAH